MTFRHYHIFTLVLGAGLLLGLPAQADLYSIRNSNNAVWAAAGGMYYNYKEHIPGPGLDDSERGGLASVAGGISYMTHRNVYLVLETSLVEGDADYNGAFLFSPTIPLQSTTTETISETDAKIGQGFALGKNTLLTPYAEIGFRYWNRDLGGGQEEDYRNFSALGGLMLQTTPYNGQWLLAAYGAGGTTFAAQVRAAPDDFDLGNAGIYKLGGRAGYFLTARTEIFTTLDYEYFRYVESPVSASGFFEPDSHTGETTARLGVSYHFR